MPDNSPLSEVPEHAHGADPRGVDIGEALPGDPEILARRSFLTRLSLALGGLAAAVVSVPIIAYLLSPLLRPSPSVWRDLGPVDAFKEGETVEVSFEEPSSLAWAGQTALTAAWLRRTGPQAFAAFAINCTHLGCPVTWQQQASLFFCPCHGGVYYADGTVAGGPPPRPLARYQVRVRDGRVELQTQPLTTNLVAQGRRRSPRV